MFFKFFIFLYKSKSFSILFLCAKTVLFSEKNPDFPVPGSPVSSHPEIPALRLRVLYSLYISSAASLVLATTSPPLGKQ